MVTAFRLTTINRCSGRFPFHSTKPPSSRMESDPPQKKLGLRKLMLLRDKGSLLRPYENSLVAKTHCFTAKNHWFAAKEYCLDAMKHRFAANEHSFEVKAHCLATKQHSFMTATFGLCQRSLLCRKGTFLCGKPILVCGYGVYFETKEVTSSRRNIADLQKAVSLAITRHLRVLMSFNADPDGQVEISANNLRTLEGGEMLAADSVAIDLPVPVSMYYALDGQLCIPT